MTKQDVVRMFKLLCSLYPASAKVFSEVDEFVRDTWYEMLHDIPREIVLAAIKSHTATNRYPPTIAEIRTESIRLTHTELAISSGEAWGMCMDVIRKNRDVKTLPEHVRAAARDIGWWEIGHSENPEAIRAQFVRFYESRINSEIKRLQEAPVVGALMEGEQHDRLLPS